MTNLKTDAMSPITAPDPTQTDAWAALTHHRDELAGIHLRTLFENDPGRFDTFSWTVGGLTIDISKQRLVTETVSLLLDLARAMDVEGRRATLFAGDAVNTTENRAALHIALRDPSQRAYTVNGSDVASEVAEVRNRMSQFAASVIDGSRTGHTGQHFDRVINIGIGGSDLGPRCVVTALAGQSPGGLPVGFVASMDGTALCDVLVNADPERTLFIICSKSFTTAETMANANDARRWLVDTQGDAAVADHMVAVSANPSAAAAFGIPPDNVFPMWDWVGGRYSVWSAIGLAVAVGCGPDAFERMLAGAHDMDRHFETAPLDQNLPVLTGALGIWNRNFWNSSATTVLPYDHRLRLLPFHLQQLIMESNGKGMTRDGDDIAHNTSPIVFGGSGSESQHSFMQLIHQSTMVVPVEFIVALDGQGDPHRENILANVLAQSEALMRGQRADETPQESGKNLSSHQVCPGNRPSTTILLDSLAPETLGSLLAFYEHRTFVEGTLWGLNSFDQWGVDLGKTLASSLISDMTAGQARAGRDSSTAGLLAAYLAQRKTSRQ